ncbi:restriction endonuclease [Streptomyces sp. 2P-4]|uniref:restriction endonuclease n=1 Tax=Streptomyces sp. 2P-4 TaxID=2931974 RepID=UPI00254058E9|nr:restriction endonuclease [Streptomyces sp. 2P-4]
MAASGGRRRRGSGGAAPAGRDVVLAVGLVVVCLGGAALFVRTAAEAGGGPPVVPILAVAALAGGAALARWSAAPGPRPPGAPPAAPPAAGAPGRPDPAPPLPEVGPEALDHEAVDPDGFEHAVAALCARDGCHRVEVAGGAGDLGADVVAVTPEGRRVVIQCKHYGEGHRVGSQDLQRFGGTCFAVHEADVAVVVTTSGFTAPAAEYAAACGIVCVDGDALAAWTGARTGPPWQSAPADAAPGEVWHPVR